jgi:mannosyltransferase OCH1-like enzyme
MLNPETRKKYNYILQQQLKIPYPMKRFYKTEIPLNIFQTWHTKDLPPLMNESVEYIKSLNPAFTHRLFDDKDCYNFIKNNFDNIILETFDKLIPGAYKADLWRYCVLYKLGGIYLDVKYRPINDFKFINLTEKEHWVLDSDKKGIYNALIVCKPNNNILLQAINQIVENVKNNYYGESNLHPTGPLLLARYFSDHEKQSFDMKHIIFENVNNRLIYFNKYIILKTYTGYIEEHDNNKKLKHYSSLWGENNIYK